MVARLWAWIGAAGVFLAAGCDGNVVVENAGGGGDGAAGGGTSGIGAAGGAGDGGTGGGLIEPTGSGGMSPFTCSPELEAASAAAPNPLGFGPTPPPSGQYVVSKVAPDALVVESASGEQLFYQWAGSSLEVMFAPGDTVLVETSTGLGAFQVITSTKQLFVATYQDNPGDFPAVTAETPHGGPSFTFADSCLFSSSSCFLLSDLVVAGEFVVTNVPVGQTAYSGPFEVHHANTSTIVCDLVSSDVRFTLAGPTDQPE